RRNAGPPPLERNGERKRKVLYLSPKECLPMSTTNRLLGWAGWSALRTTPAAGPRPALPRRKGRSPSRRRARLRLEAFEDRVVLAPIILDPSLGVRAVVGGLTQPTSMAFLGNNDFLVLEKTTGKVDHVINGVVDPTRFE